MIYLQILLFFIFFGIISIAIENIIPIILVLAMFFISIFLCFINFSIRGLCNEINISENEILIKKDLNLIFIFKNYDIINIKMNGIYDGIVLKDDLKKCVIMKYEFKKSWKEIVEIINRNSKNILMGSDFSEWKYM
jgi:hypothetical protein